MRMKFTIMVRQKELCVRARRFVIPLPFGFDATVKALQEISQGKSYGHPATNLTPEGMEDTQDTWLEGLTYGPCLDYRRQSRTIALSSGQ
jgi:hypothetical protein